MSRNRGALARIRYRAKTNSFYREFLEAVESPEACCFYCEHKFDLSSRYRRLTLDHIVCHGDGGKVSLSNLVPACNTCNSVRGDIDFLEFGIFAHFELVPITHEKTFHDRAVEMINSMFRNSKKVKSDFLKNFNKHASEANLVEALG